MALTTFSSFWYGHLVDDTSYTIDFTDASGAKTAELILGGYTPTQFSVELARAMTDVGGQEYSCVLDRATRKLTISAVDPFELNVSTGPTGGISAFGLAGFTAEKTGSNSYLADVQTGFEWLPQFKLQDYVPTSINKSPVDETLNQTITGRVESIRFGTLSFMECNAVLINNRGVEIPNYLEADGSGVENAVSFLEYATQKSGVEFMPNRNVPGIFESFILESTTESQNGTSFKLAERLSQNLPDFYDTGLMVFRKLT